MPLVDVGAPDWSVPAAGAVAVAAGVAGAVPGAGIGAGSAASEGPGTFGFGLAAGVAA